MKIRDVLAREILASALSRTLKSSFAAVLASMPNVGMEADFDRVSGAGEAAHVID